MIPTFVCAAASGDARLRPKLSTVQNHMRHGHSQHAVGKAGLQESGARRKKSTVPRCEVDLRLVRNIFAMKSRMDIVRGMFRV
jgi:hypothetical protein